MPCCSLKRICLDIVSFVRRAQNHTYRAERETSDEQRSCQFVVGSVLVMVLKLFFTVVSVGFKSAVLAINWVSVSALNFLPFAQSHGSAVMRGRRTDRVSLLAHCEVSCARSVFLEPD